MGEYVREAPLFAAILRPVEAALLDRARPLEPPVLDLGCGDGLFAAVAMRGIHPDGMDLHPKSVLLAGGRKAHRHLFAASANQLPILPNYYRTVVANSVLEHIPDLEGALSQIAAIIPPGGRLLITAPSHRFASMLLGSRLAAAYGTWFNGHSRHYHTDDAAVWTGRLDRHGFDVVQCHYYLSAAALYAFDLAHYLSLWRWIQHRLLHRWVLFPNRFTSGLWVRALARFCDASPRDEGPYVFLDARKRML